MKKIIALLLAAIMVFSLGTVAFATEGDTAPETSSTAPAEDGAAEGDKEEAAGELDWILDLPFWTVGPALKFAKIALKFVKVYVKLAIVFGIIDKDEITDQIVGMIQDAMAQQNGTEEPSTDAANAEPAPEVTQAAA